MPTGTTIAFGYDANNQRSSTTVTPAGGGSASVVNDFYQFGHLAYQTNGAGALLATYTCDERGAPVSVQVGSSSTSPRYYYVYDARGDVVNLTDASGAVVATYAYDAWGNLTTSSEAIPGANGWVNPFRFDGRDGVRYDGSDGLYWMSVRAYDPTIGRFLSRDPLARAPLFLADNPYVYAGNNPLSNVDPSGQYRAAGHGSHLQVEHWSDTNRLMARVQAVSGCDAACQAQRQRERAAGVANAAAAYFAGQIKLLPGGLLHSIDSQIDPGIILGGFGTAMSIPALLKALGQALLTGATTTGSGVLGWLGAAATAASAAWVEMLGDFLIYDLVASAYQLMFQKEAMASVASDGFWGNADGLDLDFNLVAAGMIGASIITAAWTALFTLMSPDFAVLWIGVAVAAIAMIGIRLEQHAFAYLRQEGAILGYLVN